MTLLSRLDEEQDWTMDCRNPLWKDNGVERKTQVASGVAKVAERVALGTGSSEHRSELIEIGGMSCQAEQLIQSESAAIPHVQLGRHFGHAGRSRPSYRDRQ